MLHEAGSFTDRSVHTTRREAVTAADFRMVAALTQSSKLRASITFKRPKRPRHYELAYNDAFDPKVGSAHVPESVSHDAPTVNTLAEKSTGSS